MNLVASEEFGRHFWITEDHDLMSCPTFVDGSPDLRYQDYVSDWTEPLTETEQGRLTAIKFQCFIKTRS